MINNKLILSKRRELFENQGKFAEAVGVSQNYISQIENGLRVPSNIVLQQIAEALQINIGELVENNKISKGDDSNVANNDTVRVSDIFRILEDFTKKPLDPRDKKALKLILDHISETLDD